MDNNQHLLYYLNNEHAIKADILTEKYICESLLALFFHLKGSYPFYCESGLFSLRNTISTPDFTPKSLQNLIKPALEATNDLFIIKSFISRETKSPLISALQDAIQTYIITPFYQISEKNRSDSILDFLLKMKPLFKELRITRSLVLDPSPAEKVFTLIRNGYKPMMNVAVCLLKYYAEQIKIVITSPTEAILKSPDFFIKQTDIGVELHDVPSPIPQDFAKDIAETCLAHIIKSSPAKVEKEDEEDIIFPHINEITTDTLISFDLLLPESIPEAQAPDQAIANFRAAAWSLTKAPAIKKKQKITKNYATLDEAASDIVITPLWPKAQQAQRELVIYLNKEQKLLQIVKYLGNLYLMKRGDLHLSYIEGSIRRESAADYFKQYLGNIPFFEFRFIDPDTILCSIPIRLRKIITKDQLKIYNKYYKLMLRMRQLQYNISTMKIYHSIISIRLQFFQMIIAFQQTLFFKVDVGLLKLIKRLDGAKNLEELIKFHSDFVKILNSASLSDLPESDEQFNRLFDLGFKLAAAKEEPDENQIFEYNEGFLTFKSYLTGVLTVSAQSNSSGLAAALLSSINVII